VTDALRPRVAPLPAAEWTARERELLSGNLGRVDRYLTGEPDAPAMPAILGLFARHPAVAAPWLAFSGSLLDKGSLDPRDRELLILRVAWRTRCEYEWAQHISMGQAAGLTPEQVAAVPAGAEAAIWSTRDRALLRATDQLMDDHMLDDDVWARLAEHFPERELLEVLFVVGSYLCLALVLNSVGLQPDAGLGTHQLPDAPAGNGTHPSALPKEEDLAAFPEAAGR
jgi:4-carboxymuconolactone decarboxylase